MSLLEGGLDEQIAQALQEWCNGLGARGATLVLYQDQGSHVCGPRVQPSNGLYTACIVAGQCPIQAARRGNMLAQVGKDSAEVSLCLKCRLSTSDILALHLDWPEGSHSAPSNQRKIASAAPILLLAKEGLELQVLKARLEAGERNFRADILASLKAQEDEREWLALEVHDRLAQTLAAVFQQLQTVESLARSSPEIRQVAIRGSILCRELIRETRNIMNDLRPPVLEELGLIPLVQEELRRLEEEVGCRVQQKMSCPARPSRDVEIVLYRIFHEALINVQRHANATGLTVSLDGDDAALRLQIEDNGVGFDVSETLVRKRVGGLMSMRRRAELAGGICSIESKPGHGTKVTVRIPIAEGQPAAAGGLSE